MAIHGDRELVHSGIRAAIVAALGPDGNGCPAREFLDKLSPGDRAKLVARFVYLGNDGQIKDRQKFKSLYVEQKHKIMVCEFKARGRDTGLRITCYRDGDLYILLHGFFKKEDQIDNRDILATNAILDADVRRNSGRSR